MQFKIKKPSIETLIQYEMRKEKYIYKGLVVEEVYGHLFKEIPNKL
jgi:hypothetical protein